MEEANRGQSEFDTLNSPLSSFVMVSLEVLYKSPRCKKFQRFLFMYNNRCSEHFKACQHPICEAIVRQTGYLSSSPRKNATEQHIFAFVIHPAAFMNRTVYVHGFSTNSPLKPLSLSVSSTSTETQRSL